ncbi:MAG: GNAT family N-acetyltransferase [Candidatus Sericytochromatia bacterium]
MDQPITTPLTLDVSDAPGVFYEAVRDHLERNEAENGLLLGFLKRAAGELAARPPFLARCMDGEATHSVALTTDLNLIVSRGTGQAAAAIVAALRERGVPVPGIVGPAEDVDALVAAWTAASGAPPGAVIDQMLYALREVVWPTGVPGRMRPMTEDDVELVTGWIWGFHRDALPHEPYAMDAARDNALARPAAGSTYLWELEDGVPVAMAALARPTQRGVTVNAVYTPPEHRRHGYASALVAALSDEGLKRGKDFCVLYTDLANPTANGIYQAIGYKPVSRSKNVRFATGPSA